MHGIVRTRYLKEGAEPTYKNIHRIEVRYSDGRVVCFVPEARREFFSRDDSNQVAKLLTTASSTAEWAHMREHYAD